MNDDFLARFRKAPRPEFAAALYQRINKPMKTQSLPLNLRRPALVLAALCAVVALVLAVSPAARAAMQTLIKEIGGVSFTESALSPGSDNATTAPSETMSLAEARATVPYTFGVPSWVPDGFELVEVYVSQFPGGVTPVTIVWHRTTPELVGVIILFVGQDMADWRVGPGSVEEVQINGQPAGLVRGAYNADTNQWDADSGIALMWTKGDVTYHLSGVSVEDLIRVAESIP